MHLLRILNRIKSFINNAELCTENGIYHSLVLISQFKFFRHEQFITFGINMFFELFNKYVEFDSEKYFKFLEQIIKVISQFYC